MNVYFCDVCGVRVTDTDLHSGHGMRRRNDVICAACLELGHGKGLFAQDGQKQLVLASAEPAASRNGRHPSPAPRGASAAVSAAPALPASSRVAPPDAIGQARDRAHTLDEDQPPSPVRPVSVLPAPPPGLEASPDAQTELPPEMTPEFEDTAKVPVVHQELAAAAAGFAALNPPAAKASDTGAEDVVEVPPSKLDDSGGAPVLEVDDDAEKAETAVGNRFEPESAAAPGRGAQSTARRSTSSSRTSKQSKSRGLRRGKSNHNGALIVLSAMGTLALLIFAYCLFGPPSRHAPKGGERINISVENNMRKAVSDANDAIRLAQSTQQADKAKQAIQLIDEVRRQANDYERIAKEHGLTDEDIEGKCDEIGVRPVLGMRKLLEDIEVKASENSSP